MQDPALHIIFQFLDFILPYFNNFNQLFQKNEPTIHLLHKKCKVLYSDILRFYYLPNKVTDAQLNLLDPSDENNFVPSNQVYLGPNVHKTFQDPNIASNKAMIADVTNRCRQFMVTACIQIKERFPLDSKLLRLCSTLSVANCTRSDALLNMPTLSDLATEVPRIYAGNLKKLDYEWRHILNIPIPQEIKESNNAEAFFLYLCRLRDENGQLEFTVFPQFALNILSLPTSNADAERISSKLNLIKTKTRNKMLTSTQAALAVVSETVKSKGGCVKFEPTEHMIRVVLKSRANTNSDELDEIV